MKSFPGVTTGKEPACQDRRLKERQVQSLSGEDPLEEGTTNHSSSFLENPMDRGAWWATVQEVAKSWTQLKQISTCPNTHSEVKLLVTQSCLTLQPHGLWPARLLCPWNSSGNNTGMVCHSLL